MPGNTDRASKESEYILDRQLEESRKLVPLITHTGYCHSCEEEVEAPKLFCNGDCADDFEKYKKQH